MPRVTQLIAEELRFRPLGLKYCFTLLPTKDKRTGRGRHEGRRAGAVREGVLPALRRGLESKTPGESSESVVLLDQLP